MAEVYGERGSIRVIDEVGDGSPFKISRPVIPIAGSLLRMILFVERALADHRVER